MLTNIQWLKLNFFNYFSIGGFYYHPANNLQVATLLPVAVIVVGIVTSQSSETAQANGIWEEDLGSCIHPYLMGEWPQRYSTCTDRWVSEQESVSAKCRLTTAARAASLPLDVDSPSVWTHHGPAVLLPVLHWAEIRWLCGSQHMTHICVMLITSSSDTSPSHF